MQHPRIPFRLGSWWTNEQVSFPQLGAVEQEKQRRSFPAFCVPTLLKHNIALGSNNSTNHLLKFDVRWGRVGCASPIALGIQI